MVKSKKELLKELRAKNNELRAFVSKTLGFGDLANLDKNQRGQIEDEVEDLIEKHDEALHDFDNAEEWKAQESRIAATPIGKLLQEPHEISEQILDLRDDG